MNDIELNQWSKSLLPSSSIVATVSFTIETWLSCKIVQWLEFLKTAERIKCAPNEQIKNRNLDLHSQRLYNLIKVQISSN